MTGYLLDVEACMFMASTEAGPTMLG